MTRIADAKIFTATKPIGRSGASRLVKALANRIAGCCASIDQIIATIDPEAAGAFYVAADLHKILSKDMNIKYPVDFLHVKGRQGRERTVESVPKLMPDVRSVLLVGDASFSGNTRRITKSRLQEVYPNTTVWTATLTAGKGMDKPDFFVREVAGREVAFPWGLVDATGECRIPLGTSGLPEACKFGYRVWGNYEEFALNEPCTARILTVRPRQRLSLQVHFRRDELFIVLDSNTCFEFGKISKGEHELTLEELKTSVRRAPGGGKELVLGDGSRPGYKAHNLQVGDYVLIPRGNLHRLSAPKNTVRVVEISFGHYDQERDIARLEDDYGRRGLTGQY